MTANEAIEISVGLPGEELIVPGISDAVAGNWTPEALLLLVARGRLADAGFDFLERIVPPAQEIEPLLYEALGDRETDAYGAYNSWKRRLDSYIRGLEQRVTVAKA